MRSRVHVFALALIAGSLALPHFAHAAIPFFGTIVPDNISRCAAGWGAVITIANNIIQFTLTIALVFLLPIMITYAGFLMVVNQGNPGKITQAKNIILNTVLGIVIAMAAWLIVDAVMVALYDPSKFDGETWMSLIGSHGAADCLIQEGALQNLNQTSLQVTGLSANGEYAYVFGKTGALCADGNGACSPSVLKGVGFSPAQANVMSCIAGTENSQQATGCTGNACGTFQIMLTKNQLVGPSCGGTLDCPSLCKGSSGAAVKTAACQPCVQAANNAACNAETAYSLFKQYGYKPWTDWSDNKQSAACVQQYGG